MQKVLLAVIVVLALILGAAFLCQQGESDGPGNQMKASREQEFDYSILTSSSGVGVFDPLIVGTGGFLTVTSAGTIWLTTDFGLAYSSTAYTYTLGTYNAFSAPSITTGTAASPTGAGMHLEATCPDGCSEVVIIEVFHVEKKPQNRTVPATDGLTCGVPPCPPAADGVGDHHVNRWAPPGSQQPPWLPGSSRGRKGNPANGVNYPPRVFDDTYRVVFEACAYCSAKPGDTLYQKFMGCQTFVYDRALNPPWTDPKPSDKPSHEFDLTLEEWRINHGPF